MVEIGEAKHTYNQNKQFLLLLTSEYEYDVKRIVFEKIQGNVKSNESFQIQEKLFTFRWFGV